QMHHATGRLHLQVNHALHRLEMSHGPLLHKLLWGGPNLVFNGQECCGTLSAHYQQVFLALVTITDFTGVNARDALIGATPLHLAARWGFTGGCAALLGRPDFDGIDVHLRDYSGQPRANSWGLAQ
ncbi:unnamed protein product, partial [Polarella glacialis]